MNLVRRAALSLAAAVVTVGLLGSTTPTHADTSWGQGRPAKTSTTTPQDTSWGI